jgi:hypothetical protein
MTTVTLLSELEAVNTMLRIIGEAPVSTLSSPTSLDVINALADLDETSRQVQERGWMVNKEYDLELTPDVNGHLNVDSDILRIEPTKDYKYLILTQRGTKIYNIKDRTFVFTDPVKFDVIRLLPFTDLPQALRHYIMVKAARKFQKRQISAELLDGFTEEEEAQALASAEDQDTSGNHYNILTGSYSTLDIVDRNL